MASTPDKAVPTARIRFGSWEELARFVMESDGRGLFVRAGSPPPIGTELMLQLILPDGRDLALPGRVAHRVGPEAGAEPGMGVQITHMSAEQAERLQQLMTNPDIARSFHRQASLRPGAPVPSSATTPEGKPVLPRAKPILTSKHKPAQAAPRPPAPVRAPEPAPPRPVVEPPPPSAMSPLLIQAYTLLERARFDSAERCVMDLLGDDPAHVEAQKLLLVIQARRLRSQFDFDRAMQKYRAVLRLEPEHPEAKEQVAALGHEIEHSKALFERVFGGSESKR